MAKKLIIVTTRANILTSRGYCIGPILYPFYEETSQILGMISKGADVFEVLSDGKQIKLTNGNFDKDNSVEGTVKTTSPDTNQNKQNVNNYQKNNNFNKNNNTKPFNKNNNNKPFNNNKPNVQKDQSVQPTQKDQHTKPDVIITSEKVITQPIVADVIEEA